MKKIVVFFFQNQGENVVARRWHISMDAKITQGIQVLPSNKLAIKGMLSSVTELHTVQPAG